MTNEMTIVLLVTVHIIAVMSWVGAMYFNLVLLFPMYRSRGVQEYGELMAEQGTRAVWLLYLLVALTFASGLALAWIGESWNTKPLWFGVKLGLWILMLCTHLIGTTRIWPKVFFAVPSELVGLLFRYRCWMAVSAAAGTVAVVLSVAERVAM